MTIDKTLYLKSMGEIFNPFQPQRGTVQLYGGQTPTLQTASQNEKCFSIHPESLFVFFCRSSASSIVIIEDYPMFFSELNKCNLPLFIAL